ncbi:MAG TPA: type II toxin-antitoxin system PemK/MazF family toxin [Candidatus Obscuribacterales bacterium]
MAGLNRGDIRWYTFKRPDKRRPVLVLTRDRSIGYLNDVTVAPLSTNIRDVPSEVRLTTDDGLPEECAVNLYHLQTVPKEKLGRLIAVLSKKKMEEVGQALLFALGFDEPEPSGPVLYRVKEREPLEQAPTPSEPRPEKGG